MIKEFKRMMLLDMMLSEEATFKTLLLQSMFVKVKNANTLEEAKKAINCISLDDIIEEIESCNAIRIDLKEKENNVSFDLRMEKVEYDEEEILNEILEKMKPKKSKREELLDKILSGKYNENPKQNDEEDIEYITSMINNILGK